MTHKSSMAWTIPTIFLLCLISLKTPCSTAQTWIQAGYWFTTGDLPIAGINSALFTHLICGYAGVNNSTFQLFIDPPDEHSVSAFTATVKQKNPTVTTLLSIGGKSADSLTFSSMLNQSESRKSFIDSSIQKARSYGFNGLDLNLDWGTPNSSSESENMAILFSEWRSAIESESKNSNGTQLILTINVYILPNLLGGDVRYPVESISKNLDWVHVYSFGYAKPTNQTTHTAASAALYDPGRIVSTDYGINAWINGGLSANKLVLGLPFYGYGWTLVNPDENEVGAPSNGSAFPDVKFLTYKDIKGMIQRNGGVPKYDATYVMDYCVIGSTWISYDGVDVVKQKVDYAKNKSLRGYYAWTVARDDNWELSQAAQDAGKNHNNKSNPISSQSIPISNRSNKRHWFLLILLPTTAIVILLLVSAIWNLHRRRTRRRNGRMTEERESLPLSRSTIAYAGNANSPHLRVFKFADLEKATNSFSFENKLGQGGYGPVYKGILDNGEEIAVKRLSKTSTQGFEEFKNEVVLNAKLQHINLVRVLGFCTEREEQMLIYEYMPNKSLDYYIYDSIRRVLLHWEKRVQIIEGVTQGLLYLQEYSRQTIIHRDLKASNILLDIDMKPKIADFGMARIFQKHEYEGNTSHVVGTPGYISPEYLDQGIYSSKSDVYSFGILLLQIISGKPNKNLLPYAYELWKDGKGLEFMDISLDDTHSPCKLMACMQIALLCVQENPADRPSMSDISSMLKSGTAVINTPKRPQFSTRDEQEVRELFLSQPETSSSVDDGFTTQIIPR